MKNLGSNWNRIPFKFVLLLSFAAIFVFKTTAFAGSGTLAVNPSSVNFVSVTVGTSQTQAVTLTNAGGSKLTVTQATLSGADFALTGLNYPVTLSGGQSATCYVTFTPQSTSSFSGSVSVWFSAQTNGKGHNQSGTTSTISLPLSGTGAGASGLLAANPGSLTFGSVAVGSSQTLTETLVNSGGASLTISAASATSNFVLSGLSLPLTLAAGQSASFGVMFSPTTSGSIAGSTTFTSNASNPTLIVPLSGAGLTAGQLNATPTSQNFGSVAIGNSVTLSQTLTNTGGSGVTISQIAPSGTGFNFNGISLPFTLSAGQSTTFNVTFSPTSAGVAAGGIAITSTASNPTLSVSLSGTGVTQGQLAANPYSLSFGSVAVGSSVNLSQTLTNSGGSAVTISKISPTGTGFAFSGISLPITLAAGQSSTFNVSFTPQAGGSITGSLVITSNGSNPSLSVPLSGTGSVAGQLTITPASVNFGSVVVGQTQTQTATLGAATSAVTVSSLGVGGSQFSVNGVSLPVTIAAGSSISFQVAFAPQTSGSSSSNVTFISNASNSPAVQTLSGTATMPQHSVALSWNTSSSSGVVGYNVYRATASAGPYTRINSAVVPAPFSSDSTVQGGQTYYYVTTAVDSSGMESSYSNQVQAVVPSP